MARKRTAALDIYQELLAGEHLNRNIRKINDMVDDDDPFALYVVYKIYEDGIKDIYPNKRLAQKYRDKAYPKLVALVNHGDEDAEQLLASFEAKVSPKAIVSAEESEKIDSDSVIKTSKHEVDPLEELRLAENYLYHGHKLDRALRIIKKHCRAKDGYAYYIAGAILRYGIKDLEPNEAQSERYFKLAFDALKTIEEKNALRFVAALYRDGFGGVPVDLQASLDLFTKSSACGDVKSSVYLAHYYENPTHPDMNLASKFWEIAVAQGSLAAVGTIGGGGYDPSHPTLDITVNPRTVSVDKSNESEKEPAGVIIYSDIPVQPKASLSVENKSEPAADTEPEIMNPEPADVPESRILEDGPVIQPVQSAVGTVYASEVKLDLKEVQSPASADEETAAAGVTADVAANASEDSDKQETSVGPVEYVIADEMTKSSTDIIDKVEKVDIIALRTEISADVEKQDEAAGDIILIKALRLLRTSESDEKSAALPLIKEAAKTGSIRALVLLGYLYENGIVVRTDSEAALECYGLAADRGSATASYRRGLMYLPAETEVALYNIRKAAKMGLPKALNELGNMHYEGQFGLRAPAVAYRFYGLAADRNDPTAFYNLSVLDEKADNPELAAEHLQRAIALGFDLDTIAR